MLLFIPSATAVAVVRARFNTSHVTLYLYQFHSLKKLLLCFNTSHVTLYPGHPFKCGWMGWVSIHLMLLFICLRNARFVHFSISFNTSHVTLYHGIRQCTIQKQSRFNTSHVTLYLFSASNSAIHSARFNTSHGTLYHIHKDLNIGNLCCFNTSHVTLYRTPCFKVQHIILVSIHLMLLFIYGDGEFYVNTIQFQYISCYSLSLVL